MVCADFIARYETLRSRLDERLQFLGVEAALRDEEAGRLDAELVAIEWLLPDGYRYLDETE